MIGDHGWIKMRMKTLTCFNKKGNEVITWCLFGIRSCFLLSNHCRCTCYHCWCLLHSIYANQINNDNVHKIQKLSLEIKIFICHQVWRGKRWEISLQTCAPFSKTIVAIIFRNVSWVVICSFPQRHWSKWGGDQLQQVGKESKRLHGFIRWCYKWACN